MNPNQNNKHRYFRGGRGRFFYKNRGGRNVGFRKTIGTNLGYVDKGGESSQTEKRDLIRAQNDKNCPYKGWELYFSGHDYEQDSPTVKNVKAFESFLNDNPTLYDAATVERTQTFQIDVNVLYNDKNIKGSWENFEDDLKNSPNHSISCIGLAIHQVVLTQLSDENVSFEPGHEGENEIDLPMIQVRILNFGPVLHLRNLKSNYFGKLITVKGTVIRVGNIKLTCTWMTFQCERCEAVQYLKQTDGICTFPLCCVDRECRSKSFIPLLSSPHTKTLNWQCIRLQEIVTDENREGGRVPRTIDCELTADLVETCSPGDVALLTGIIKIKSNEEGSKQKHSNIFHQYMDVVSVINCKNKQKEAIPGIEFSEKNYYGIKEIFSEKNLFRLIVQSLCPAIFGHEIVKAGLILAMFGGCQRYEDCRANPHVLVVGDPGLGKSRMLQACASATPRGVYVCGNTSTTSGLTVTLARESGGDCVLEAGALVLSDQGCCCIDEFDKMSSQHQALLEAMEQQTVSIAKSGVVCALPCRVSILAAANPVGGHYNKAKTVSENLKLGPSLLSRFDLVFILMDQPSVQADSMLSDHVMAMHSGGKGNVSLSTFSSSMIESPLQYNNRETLIDKLKVPPGEELDLIPHQLLRKYIAYAKQYVKPKLTSEAADILMNFYRELRQCHQNSDSTPVTPRQLESLIRFTEARAKLELREEATAADAEDVIQILRHSLLDMFADEYGDLDFTRSQNGSGMSGKNQVKKFISTLQRISDIQCKSVFTIQELKNVAKQASISVSDFTGFLSTLNVQGYLLKKGSQLYQLLSVD
ncbi:hypothetical protein RUM43_007968 [Polyplax serrata]|uniref:DNA helicase MCM8 n=1 Tax=Polyplax serrata TaxID=468196 RepID=A0AAN8S237_POLSC